MPKRTNEFQQLVHRLERVLHPVRCKVEESSMVHNYTTGKDEEIDIVISFEMGGRLYRTAVHVQDRSRKSGPDWIRSIRGQKADCKLDRVVAVHSKGFSEATKAQAQHDGIELIVPNISTDMELIQAINCGLEAMSTVIAKPTNLKVVFLTQPEKDIADGYKAREATATIVTTGGARYAIKALLNTLSSAIQDLVASTMKSEIPENEFLEVPFIVHCIHGTKLEFSDGVSCSVVTLHGTMEVLVISQHFTRNQAVSYKGKTFLDSTGDGVRMTSHIDSDGRTISGAGEMTLPTPPRLRRFDRVIVIRIDGLSPNGP